MEQLELKEKTEQKQTEQKKQLLSRCPLLALLVLTGLVLTCVAANGLVKGTLLETDYDPVNEPMLSLVFRNAKESSSDDSIDEAGDPVEGTPYDILLRGIKDQIPQSLLDQESDFSEQLEDEEEIQPTRETTKEEYRNHISADVYGTAGVERAARAKFQTVDLSYFDDALFIGDSRIVGLQDYSDLGKTADFLAATSLMIYDVLAGPIENDETVEQALQAKQYGKIYIMVGINELGRGTTEGWLKTYRGVVEQLRAWAPDATIYVMAMMSVTREKSDADAIFNLSNITARNHAAATLANNKDIFYIDVNEAVCDSDGYLCSDYTYDQIHPLGRYYSLVQEYLLNHAAVLPGKNIGES